MKIRIIVVACIVILRIGSAFGQVNMLDISVLPKANAIQRDTFNRWGERWNIVNVDFMFGKDGELNFNYALIEAEIEKGGTTYILFPTGGSETDIFIYPILKYTAHDIDINYQDVLKKKVFMWGDDIKDKIIQIDDLNPGFYFVKYISCHYVAGYILWIKEHKKNP